jgi:hypothetical protein
MLTKAIIALSAAALLGSITAATAYDVPENRIGDRYPFLDRVNPTAALVQKNTVVGWMSVDVPENRITDRYPQLAPKFGGSRVTAARVASTVQSSADVPENRISDRYPFLEQTSKTPVLAVAPTATRMHARMQKTGKKV